MPVLLSKWPSMTTWWVIMNRIHSFSALLLSTAIGLSTADASSETFRYNGFISQSIIVSEDNPFYDRESGTHLRFREIGLNGTWQPHSRLRFTGQLLSRKAGAIDDGDPEVDLLSVDYQFLAHQQVNAGIRLGRLKNNFGLYNVTRDIPQARVGAVVPQSVYFESFRDAVLLVDGAELYASGHSNIGSWAASINYGDVDVEEGLVEAQYFQREIIGGFSRFEDRSSIHLEFEPDAIPGLKLSVSNLSGNIDLEDVPTLSLEDQLAASIAIASDPFAAFEYLTSMNLNTDIYMFSGQYRRDSWAVSAEYLEIKTITTDVTILGQPGVPDTETDSEGYYLQFEWTPSNWMSFYSRAERLYYTADDKDGTDSALLLGLNPAGRFSEIMTLGARWSVNEAFAITGQFSRNKGFGHAVGSTGADYAGFDERWDLGIIQFSYHF